MIVSMKKIMDTKVPTRVRRRSYSLDEKLAIIGEAEQPGASVSQVARNHDLNTNLLFTWRRQLRRGELGGDRRLSEKGLLPVRVLAIDPVEAVREEPPPCAGVIEVELPGGRIRLHGRVDSETLGQVLARLGAR